MVTRFLHGLDIRRKLLLFGLLIIVAQGLATLLLAVVTGTRTIRTAQQLADEAVIRELDATMQPLVSLLEAQNDVLQQHLDIGLRVASDILERERLAVDRTRRVAWEATNQYSGETATLDLPRWRFRSGALVPTRDFDRPLPVVDEATRLSGLTATLFQRMNPGGDMLRVATTVESDGARAVGTYIPAVNPDGTPNPVVADLLAGRTYRGRAFVVDRWYLTVYQPIRDARGELLGALYVGVPQEAVKSIRRALGGVTVGKTGYVFVLGGKGRERGRYVLSHGGLRDGEDISGARDADGKPFIEELVDKTVGLGRGQYATTRYSWQNASDEVPRQKVTRSAYFPAWDWVVAAGAYEDDFREAHQTMNRGLREMLLSFVVVTCVVGVAGALGLLWFAGSLSRRLRMFVDAFAGLARGDLTVRVNDHSGDEVGQLADQLSRTTEGLAVITRQLRGSADSVAGGAQTIATGSESLSVRTQEQASSLEETASTMSQIAVVVKASAEQAERARGDAIRAAELAATGRDAVIGAADAMSSVARSSREIRQVVDLVDDLALQTNLLSLNAAVEAARAGDEGRGFAVVAKQVRQLAERSGEAARQIRVLVATTHEQIGSTHERVTASAETLAEILAAARTVAENVADIATASREQSMGIEEINRTVTEMDRMTQQNATLVEESTSSAGRLSDDAAELRRIASQFRVA